MARPGPMAGTGSAGTRPGPHHRPLPRLSEGGPRVLLLAALVACGIGIPAAVLTGATAPALPGLADPGSTVRWGLPLVAAIRDVSAAATIGFLLVGGFLLSDGARRSSRASTARYAATAGGVWTLSAVVVTVLGFADLAGEPLSTRGFLAQMWTATWQIPSLRVVAVSALLACVVTLGASLTHGRDAQARLCGLGLLALLPLALGGHASSAADPASAESSLAVHLLAVALWVGGLLALVALRPLLGTALAGTVERYSALAGCCFVAVALSGVLNAWIHVGGLAGLVTPYGLLVLGKALALALLGLAGWRQRRAVIGRLRADPAATGAFTRLATAEAVVMGAAIGLATVLARSAPPASSALGAGHDHAALGRQLLPPTLGRVLLSPAPDLLGILFCLLLAALYLAGVQRLRRRGDHWPLHRTVTWLSGVFVLYLVTGTGFATYALAQFSAHMGQHMVLNMYAPILLVLGAPVTLALRALPATGEARRLLLRTLHSRLLAVLSSFPVAVTLFAISLYGLYFTPLFSLLMSSPEGHLAMQVHFLASGYLFFWTLIGPDPGPRRPPEPVRLAMILPIGTAHAFFAVILTFAHTLLGLPYLAQVKPPWVDLHWEQMAAGGIAGGSAELPMVGVGAVLFLRWFSAQQRRNPEPVTASAPGPRVP